MAVAQSIEFWNFLQLPQRALCKTFRLYPISSLHSACAIVSHQTFKACGREVACRHLRSVSLSNGSPNEDSSSPASDGHKSKTDTNLLRRRLQVSFTCDACGERSQRLINPHAYTRGTVFVQCAGCEVYHKLVDNLDLIEEYDYRLENNSGVEGGEA
ncbi:hypothetical protein L7F22_001741 [Adiantum nelumboides]|nr:hypothetical protein [Adiantum nelumboides]